MPKSSIPQLPLQGIFALAKPSGPTTMGLLTRLKPLFSSSRLFMEPDKIQPASSVPSAKMKNAYPGPTVPGALTGKDRGKDKKGKKGGKTNWKKVAKQYLKMGSGGTLDPLAEGVLIIGVGSGTKDLSQFLNCTKTYRAVGLLGCETDSYDSEGAIARLAPWKHVTTALLEQKLAYFRGEILQTPPIYSALKIDGRPLYEYARQNKPLPRPIEARRVTISRLELTGFVSSNHQFRFPSKTLDSTEAEERNKVLQLIEKAVEKDESDRTAADATSRITGESSAIADSHVGQSESVDLAGDKVMVSESDEVPPTFELEMTVSSGTYVRSVVHDLGVAVGSAAHVVVLTRLRQGQFVLDLGDGTRYNGEPNPTSAEQLGETGKGSVTDGYPCVDWNILENAVLKWENDEEIEVDEEGWAEWEREILLKWPKQGEWKYLGNKDKELKGSLSTEG